MGLTTTTKLFNDSVTTPKIPAGTIIPADIDETAAYTWTGLHTFERTISTATGPGVTIEATPTLATDGCGGGYLFITGDRATAWTATGGNPDTGIKIRMENNTNSGTSYGGVRCIDAMARNDDTNASCANIHTAYLTAENTDDVNTTCADMQVLQLIMNNQGIVTTNLYGLRILENSNGTNPTANTIALYITTATWDPSSGTRTDAIKIGVGSGASNWTDGIDISGATTGINLTGTFTTGISGDSATITPDASRTNAFITFGDRTAEKTINITGSSGVAYHLDPVQMNVNVTCSTAPDTTSTWNMYYLQITHDTTNMSNLRLKGSDWTITVAKNIQDVYVYQGEIDITGNCAVGGEAAGIGITVNVSAGTVTGNVWGEVIAFGGASIPSSSAALFLSARNTGTVGSMLYIESNVDTSVTNAIKINNVSRFTNMFLLDSVAGFVAANALVPATAPDATTMGADACLKVLIGAVPYYIPLYNTLHA